MLKNTAIKDLVIYDGFHVPMKVHPRSRLAQTYLTKTDHGYYKNYRMVLTNQELYLYNDRYHDDYNNLLILTPGVFVKSLPAINFTADKPPHNQEVNKAFPIELFVGGSKFGKQGVFTFGFETQEI